MNESNANNQPPIFKFLLKHKWRIILPILFFTIYYGIPRFMSEPIACQYYLFVTSARNVPQEELNKEVMEVSNQISSDEYLRGLITKYNLFEKERKSGVNEKEIIANMRKRTRFEPNTDNTSNGVMVYIWAHFWDEDPQKVSAIVAEISSTFESNTNLNILKYIPPTYDYNPWRGYVLIGSVMQGATFALLLILLWEIPKMFYSPKTQKLIFESIRADWEEELAEAKLRGETWKALQINIRYSFAFLAAMIQKSPLGDLFEFFGKFAK